MNGFDWYVWVGLPLLVFFARVTDVTLGTIRIISTSRGKTLTAPLLGFLEVFIRITIIAQIITGPQNIVAYLAYAGGFAAGTYIGMYIENKLAMGMLAIRIIIPGHSKDLTVKLHEKGYGFTIVDAEGAQGPVKLIFTIIVRKDLPEVASIIHQAYPKAFFTVEEMRSVERGVFPPSSSFNVRNIRLGRSSK